MLVVKNPPANAGDSGNTGPIPGPGRFPGAGNGNSSILAWKMDRGAWRAIVHGATKSLIQLSTHTHFPFTVITK